MARRGEEILTLAANGFTDKQIAEELKISVRTVESHWRRMREETGVPNRSGLLGLMLNQRVAKQQLLFEEKIQDLQKIIDNLEKKEAKSSELQTQFEQQFKERSKRLYDELNQLYQEVNELKSRHIHGEVLNSIVLKSNVLAYRITASKPYKPLYVSDSVRQFGYKPDDFTQQGLPISALTHPEDFVNSWGNALFEFDRGERILDRQYRLVTKHGDIRTVFERCILELDQNGKPESIAAFAFDITHLGHQNQVVSTISTL